MITPRKSLGQHFLQDENIVRKIAAAVDPQPDEAVLEIGPGTGVLTKVLVDRCRLTAVEVDPRAVSLLKQSFGDRLRLLEADVRTIDAGELARSAGRPIRVVGNIPYYLTSDILIWLFDHPDAVKDATLMMQKEVADRLVAEPRTKAYGILSVYARHYARTRKLFPVSRTCFHPVPEVDSTVVQLSLLPSRRDVDDALFRSVVRATFGKRRKTLRNGLSYLGLTKEQLSALGSGLDRRPEELTAEEFVALVNRISSV